MRRIVILIVSLITISTLLFVILAKAEHLTLTEDEALSIGEEKYLEFLWMVDGAFNNEKLGGEFVVNGKELKDKNKKFTCIYKNKKDDSCIGNNFPLEFKKLFASNITHDMVYGDGAIYTWVKYEKGKYIFTNTSDCSTSRMNLNQSLKLENMSNTELTFRVTSNDDTYKKIKTKMFVLVKEDNDWKVSRAYYHDICEMDYNIG